MLLGEMSAGFQAGLIGAGAFLLWGMALGVWKFVYMRRPPAHRAPIYVDIAHRAALLYAFAALVIGVMAEFSAFKAWINLWAVLINLLFFASAVMSYVVHGWLKTDHTQYRHKNFITTWGTWLLIIGELGGTALLLGGVVLSTL